MIIDEYPVVPHPIVRSQVEPNKLYYVGDGDHFVLAIYAPYMSHRANGKLKRGAWLHGHPDSPWYEKPITVEPLYFLAVEEAFAKSQAEDQIVKDGAASPQAPRGGEGWNCGNGGLTAQLALLVIAGHHAQLDSDTIAHVEILAQSAGPEFASYMINRLKHDAEVPF